MYVYLYAVLCSYHRAQYGQKSSIDALELELQAVMRDWMWVLVTKYRSFARTVQILIQWVFFVFLILIQIAMMFSFVFRDLLTSLLVVWFILSWLMYFKVCFPVDRTVCEGWEVWLVGGGLWGSKGNDRTCCLPQACRSNVILLQSHTYLPVTMLTTRMVLDSPSRSVGKPPIKYFLTSFLHCGIYSQQDSNN